MKVSKLVVLSVACIAGVAFMCPSFVMAQDGESVDANSILQPKQETQAEKTDVSSYLNADNKKIVEEGLAEAKAENDNEETLAKKLELAGLMHQIRPTRVQVDSAVRRASMRLPETERQGFITAMQSMLNYNAIEKISVDAMVETYTLKELKSMYEYFSKEEAKSASLKMGQWAKKVHPEVVRMIDRAMMRMKTGK